jgi:hypothetical protein
MTEPRETLDPNTTYETRDFSIEHEERGRGIIIRNRKNPKLAIRLTSGWEQNEIFVMGEGCLLLLTLFHELIGFGAHDSFIPAAKVFPE